MTGMQQQTNQAPVTRRRSAEQSIIILLAGKAAERHAFLLSGIRNRRILLWDWRVSIHEAAHIVAARVAGEYCHYVSIVPRLPNPELGVTGYSGVAKHSGEKSPVDPSKIPDRLEGDVKKAALLCWLFGGATWRGGLYVYRSLKAETDCLVEDHWQAIKSLALALIERKTLVQAEINQVLSACE